MNELAAKQIIIAESLRIQLGIVNDELAALRPSRARRIVNFPAHGRPILNTLGPLLANGMFYSHGIDKFTGRAFDCCPTCGQRLR